MTRRECSKEVTDELLPPAKYFPQKVRMNRKGYEEHVVEAQMTPLDFRNEYLSKFPKQEDFYVPCAGGYRSVIASTILKSRGFHNLFNVQGGFEALKAAGAEIACAQPSSFHKT